MGSIDRLAIYERDNGQCGICGQPVAVADLHIDHIIERVAGGTDAPENLRATHAACNRKRGARAVAGAYRRPYKPAVEVAFNVRFPESVRDRVKSLAVQDRRSMNSEIIELLEEAIAARERKTAGYAYPMAGDVVTARLLRAAEQPPAYEARPRRPRPAGGQE